MTLGTTAIPRWSQNSAPVTTGQWCLIPDVLALRWSSSDVPALSPPWLSPCSQAGSTSPHFALFFILSFREGRRNIGKEASSPVGSQGLEKVYIPLPINIRSVGEGPEKWCPSAKWCPTPTHLVDLPTTMTHSTGGTGAPSRRRLSITCPNSHPPTPTSRPP